ncbi:MAG: DUF951 domain-containing protein [Chloroflexota bacterium]|mgnify:FL=1
MAGPIEFRMDDIVRLRKPHPCGGFEWQIVRLGADIRLKCLTCGRLVLLERRELEKRLKSFVQRGRVLPEPPAAAPPGRPHAG